MLISVTNFGLLLRSSSKPGFVFMTTRLVQRLVELKFLLQKFAQLNVWIRLYVVSFH